MKKKYERELLLNVLERHGVYFDSLLEIQDEELALESLTVMEVIIDLENIYDIFFLPEDITLENFSSISSIERIIKKTLI